MASKLFFHSVSQNPIFLSGDPSVETVTSESILRGREFNNAVSGLDNIPVSPQFRSELKQNLDQDEHRTLYQLKRPNVLVFTFPNGETRHFVISNSGVLLERDDYWLKYFSFIEKSIGGYKINININEENIISSEDDFIWAPDMPNFTHFLIDSLAPIASISQNSSYLRKLPIPQFSEIPAWQNEYMSGFGEIRNYSPTNHKVGQATFTIFRPKTLMLPIITSTLSRILAIREFVRARWGNPEPVFGVDRFPIYLTRNDHRSARIKNSKEIQELIVQLGGFTIDPSKLNSRQKLQLFNMPGIFIAEGSGTTNISVFSNLNSRLIVLCDFDATKQASFIRGGWPYLDWLSNRMDTVLGKETQILPGSPLASNVFDLAELRNLIESRKKPL